MANKLQMLVIPNKHKQTKVKTMFKQEINGETYYCFSEQEKEQILNVLNKVEELGD